MTDTITPSNVTFAIGILGIIFSIYSYFRNPQIKSEKTETVLALKIQNLAEELVDLKKNHIHTLETKYETMNTSFNTLANQVTRLATIIEERIPKRD